MQSGHPRVLVVEPGWEARSSPVNSDVWFLLDPADLHLLKGQAPHGVFHTLLPGTTEGRSSNHSHRAKCSGDSWSTRPGDSRGFAVHCAALPQITAAGTLN